MKIIIITCTLSVFCAAAVLSGVVPGAAFDHGLREYSHTPFAFNGNYGGK